MSGHHAHHHSPQSKTDPVCGMSVEPNAGKPSVDHDGGTFHFCSAGCYEKFEADPDFYLSGAHKGKAKSAPKAALYTCPMHPEIVEDHPGACPICGMALEPMGVPTDEPNHELIDFSRRFWVSAALAIPLLILTMGPMVGLNIRDWIGERTSVLIELALATPVVL